VSSLAFIGIWLFLLGAGAALLSIWGLELETAITAAATTLGNIGPGMHDIAPSKTFAPFAPGAKLVMAALMVLGRLEIYTVLIILTPGFWRR
jgi:trk system potassium uptake protein TrkH